MTAASEFGLAEPLSLPPLLDDDLPLSAPGGALTPLSSLVDPPEDEEPVIVVIITPGPPSLGLPLDGDPPHARERMQPHAESAIRKI
jgi:hypothetical protein